MNWNCCQGKTTLYGQSMTVRKTHNCYVCSAIIDAEVAQKIINSLYCAHIIVDGDKVIIKVPCETTILKDTHNGNIKVTIYADNLYDLDCLYWSAHNIKLPPTCISQFLNSTKL